MKRAFAFLTRCALLVVLAVIGCGGRPLTAADIDMYGTHTYASNKEKTFAAAGKALDEDEYEIAISDLEKGVIRTRRKVVGRAAVGSRTVAQELVFKRLWELEFKDDGKGGTIVRATPHMYQNDEEHPHTDPVWVIDGESGLKQLWTKLFDSIQNYL